MNHKEVVIGLDVKLPEVVLIFCLTLEEHTGHNRRFFNNTQKSPVFAGSFAVTSPNRLKVVFRLLISTFMVPMGHIQVPWPKSDHQWCIYSS